MKKNKILVLALAVLFLGGSVIYMARRGKQSGLRDAGVTTKIVVATKTLDGGSLITKEDVSLVEWPKSVRLRGSFSDPAQVVDRTLKVAVQVNEPFLEFKLAPKETGRSQ